MKNILIITLGTRDIQFLKSDIENSAFKLEEKKLIHSEKKDISFFCKDNTYFEEYIFPGQPRIAGAIIQEYFDLFRDIIKIPLIENALNHILKENEILDNIIFVYTDQKDIDPEDKKKSRFYNSDTLHYPMIIESLIKYKLEAENISFSSIGVYGDVTDNDKKYNEFAKKCKSLYEKYDQIERVYLLPQGGIDQINHALTLQLIQAFGTKVKLWQQAEADEPKELKFPFLFIQDLNNQKILKHLADYDFGMITNELTTNKIIRHLCKYADRRLSLNHRQLGNNLEYLNNNLDDHFFQLISLPTEKNKIVVNNKLKLQDLYYSIKIKLKQEKYSEFLWRLFTLAENLYKIDLEDHWNVSIDDYYDKKIKALSEENQKWISFLNSKDRAIVKILQKNKLSLSNPIRKSLQKIHEYLLSKNSFKHTDEQKSAFREVYRILENFTNSRNKIAHELSAIQKEKINSCLSKNMTLDCFISKIDTILNIKGFGIYDDIRKEIKKML
jgi:hypothetical protein